MFIIIKKHLTNQTYVATSPPAVHYDEKEALAEAERLAIANPGWEFIVCEGRFAVVNMPRIVQRTI